MPTRLFIALHKTPLPSPASESPGSPNSSPTSFSMQGKGQPANRPKLFINPFDIVENVKELSLQDLPLELQSVLKRLSKKDLNTRVKGLSELDLFIKAPSSDIESLSTYFPKIYTAHIFDPERRIRQLANQCLLELTRREKTFIRNFLKDIGFYWIASLFDPVGSVSLVAKHAFSICFRPEKVPEACAYLAESILATAEQFLSFRAQDNTTVLIAQGMSTEDAKFVFCLEFGASLNAVQFIAKHCLGTVDNDKLLEQLGNFVHSNLSRLLTSAAPNSEAFIRKSTNRLITTLAMHHEKAATNNHMIIDAPLLAAFCSIGLKERAGSNYVGVLELLTCASNFESSIIWEYQSSSEHLTNNQLLSSFFGAILVNCTITTEFEAALHTFVLQYADNNEQSALYILTLLWNGLNETEPIYDKERLKRFISLYISTIFVFQSIHSFTSELIVDVVDKLILKDLYSVSKTLTYSERIKLLTDTVPDPILSVALNAAINNLKVIVLDHQEIPYWIDEFLTHLPLDILQLSKHNILVILAACAEKLSYLEMISIYIGLVSNFQSRENDYWLVEAFSDYIKANMNPSLIQIKATLELVSVKEGIKIPILAAALSDALELVAEQMSIDEQSNLISTLCELDLGKLFWTDKFSAILVDATKHCLETRQISLVLNILESYEVDADKDRLMKVLDGVSLVFQPPYGGGFGELGNMIIHKLLDTLIYHPILIYSIAYTTYFADPSIINVIEDFAKYYANMSNEYRQLLWNDFVSMVKIKLHHAKSTSTVQDFEQFVHQFTTIDYERCAHLLKELAAPMSIDLYTKYLIFSSLQNNSYAQTLALLELHLPLAMALNTDSNSFYLEDIYMRNQAKIQAKLSDLLARYTNSQLSYVLALTTGPHVDCESTELNRLFTICKDLSESQDGCKALFYVWKRLGLEFGMDLAGPSRMLDLPTAEIFRLCYWIFANKSAGSSYLDTELDSVDMTLKRLESILSTACISESILRSDQLNMLLNHCKRFSLLTHFDLLVLVSKCCKFITEEFWVQQVCFLEALFETCVALITDSGIHLDIHKQFILKYALAIVSSVSEHSKLTNVMEPMNALLFKVISMFSQSPLSTLPPTPLTHEISQELAFIVRKWAPFWIESLDVNQMLESMYLMNVDLLLACRFIIMLGLDDELQRMQLSLEKGEFQFSWTSLYNILLDTDLNMPQHRLCQFLGFEMFLCLVEGAREEAKLFSELATIFKNELAARFISKVQDTLAIGTTDEVNLSTIEFMNLDLDAVFDKGYRNVKVGELRRIAANLFGRMLKILPSTFRTWYSFSREAKQLSNNSLENYVGKYISPVLVAREVGRIQRYRTGKGTSDLQIKSEQTTTAHNIVATYKIEEFSMQIRINLPSTYPVKATTVTGIEKVGISETKWRGWLLASQTILNNQNASILDALLAWKENIDKSFEGIEPCSICYCIIHPTDRTMPNPTCKTCRNKFHSSCLYKWFKTGGQATCPMCRTLF